MAEEGCTYCELAAVTRSVPSGLIYEGEDWFVCHCPAVENGQYPLPGMLVMATRTHVDDLGSLTQRAASRMGLIQKFAVQVVQNTLAVDLVYLFQTDEHSRHVHAFVIPRYETMRGFQQFIAYQIFNERVWYKDAATVAPYARALLEGWHLMNALQPTALIAHDADSTIQAPTLAAVNISQKRRTMSIIMSSCCNAPLIRQKVIGDPLLCSKCLKLAFDPGAAPTGSP